MTKGQENRQDMSEFSREHHDFVDPSDISRVAAHNQSLEQADFLEDVSILRAEVFQKLFELSALRGDGFGWAVFRPETEHVADEPLGRETLVLVDDFSRSTSKKRISTVRIVTNDLYMVDDRVQWLVQDFSLDEDDDTQYLVSVREHGVQPKSLGEAALFCVSDGQLFIDSFTPFTPLAMLPYGPRPEDRMAPFGRWTKLRDKIDALAVGRELFDEATVLQPEHIWTPISS